MRDKIIPAYEINKFVRKYAFLRYYINYFLANLGQIGITIDSVFGAPKTNSDSDKQAAADYMDFQVGMKLQVGYHFLVGLSQKWRKSILKDTYRYISKTVPF